MMLLCIEQDVKKSFNLNHKYFQIFRDPEQRVRILLHWARKQQPVAQLVRCPPRWRDRIHLRTAVGRVVRILGEGQEVVHTDDDFLG